MSRQRCRLTARAQMNGALCEPGHEFFLAAGEKGPTRAVVASNHGSHQTGHHRFNNFAHPGAMREEPLYVVVETISDDPPIGY